MGCPGRRAPLRPRSDLRPSRQGGCIRRGRRTCEGRRARIPRHNSVRGPRCAGWCCPSTQALRPAREADWRLGRGEPPALVQHERLDAGVAATRNFRIRAGAVAGTSANRSDAAVAPESSLQVSRHASCPKGDREMSEALHRRAPGGHSPTSPTVQRSRSLRNRVAAPTSWRASASFRGTLDTCSATRTLACTWATTQLQRHF